VKVFIYAVRQHKNAVLRPPGVSFEDFRSSQQLQQQPAFQLPSALPSEDFETTKPVQPTPALPTEDPGTKRPVRPPPAPSTATKGTITSAKLQKILEEGGTLFRGDIQTFKFKQPLPEVIEEEPKRRRRYW
jgi:hypothetical protein